jgi:hypothetical protein
MHMSFVGCISKLVAYPIGFASTWHAGLTGTLDQNSSLDTSLCLMFTHAPSTLMTNTGGDLSAELACETDQKQRQAKEDSCFLPLGVASCCVFI